MCGIIGCLLKNKDAAPILCECVKKLEYRGYDSIGIATLNNHELSIKKSQGKVDEVNEKLKLNNLLGSTGIAHVRWATHGNPTTINAHPHTDCHEQIAVVHNGIIENYKELKQELEEYGHVFTSNTDTEVIPHLIEKYIDNGLELEDAIRQTTLIIKGSYALAVISTIEPDKIIGVRKESPLIIGLGEDEYYIASDVPAILKHTNKVIYMDDEEMVILKDTGVTIKNNNEEILTKKVNTIDYSANMGEKQDYEYYTIKEIHEQPLTVKNTLMEESEIRKLTKKFPKFQRICFVACGTSYHASLVGKYLFETLQSITTIVVLASEFEYMSNTLDENTLVILITQSGETADTLEALKVANQKSTTLTIVNTMGSTASRIAQHVIYTKAGPEIGVAATKTYISQLTAIYLLIICMSNNNKLLKQLEKVPEYIKTILEREEQIKIIAEKYKNTSGPFFYIGRGYSHPTALEGALKLKEITYIHGEGYAAGELKHGPLALIKKDTPVVAITPPGPSHDKTVSNIKEVKTRGAKVIILGSNSDDNLKSEAADYIPFPDAITEILSPLSYIIPLQLLAYYISIQKDLNPDQPKNLAKCVTVP